MSERPSVSIRRLLRRGAIAVIRGYQIVLSPLLGMNCRFQPTCSQYTREAIERYGVIRGVRLGVQRICRCHPWHPGGFDPVPELNPTDRGRDRGASSP